MVCIIQMMCEGVRMNLAPNSEILAIIERELSTAVTSIPYSCKFDLVFDDCMQHCMLGKVNPTLEESSSKIASNSAKSVFIW